MNLLLFIVQAIWGIEAFPNVFAVVAVLNIIVCIIVGLLEGGFGFLGVAFNIILWIIFAHTGYPIKPMLWCYLIASIVGLQPLDAVANIIGMILFYNCCF